MRVVEGVQESGLVMVFYRYSVLSSPKLLLDTRKVLSACSGTVIGAIEIQSNHGHHFLNLAFLKDPGLRKWVQISSFRIIVQFELQWQSHCTRCSSLHFSYACNSSACGYRTSRTRVDHSQWSAACPHSPPREDRAPAPHRTAPAACADETRVWKEEELR